MNEDNDKKSLSTVESAMNYIDTPANNFSSWKLKDLGLQFLLFGVAEMQARRVVKLLKTIDVLEEVAFSEDAIRELEPVKAIIAQKQVAESLKDATEYIFKTRKEMKWDEVHNQLNDMSFNEKIDGADEIQFAKIANKLLEITPKSVKNDNE